MAETKAHTVRFHIHDGLPEWRMRCPFALGDTTRPCWPHEEDDTKSLVGDCCTYVSWFENCDVLDVVNDASLVEWAVAPHWDEGEPSFDLVPYAAPHRTAVTGREKASNTDHIGSTIGTAPQGRDS